MANSVNGGRVKRNPVHARPFSHPLPVSSVSAAIPVVRRNRRLPQVFHHVALIQANARSDPSRFQFSSTDFGVNQRPRSLKSGRDFCDRQQWCRSLMDPRPKIDGMLLISAHFLNPISRIK